MQYICYGSGYFAVDNILPLELILYLSVFVSLNGTDLSDAMAYWMVLLLLNAIIFRQWLFCCRRQFTLRDYFAMSYL